MAATRRTAFATLTDLSDLEKVLRERVHKIADDVDAGRFAAHQVLRLTVDQIRKDFDDQKGGLATRDQIDALKKTVSEIKDSMVTQDQFWPVKALMYGLVALMLAGIVTGILALVLK